MNLTRKLCVYAKCFCVEMSDLSSDTCLFCSLTFVYRPCWLRFLILSFLTPHLALLCIFGHFCSSFDDLCFSRRRATPSPLFSLFVSLCLSLSLSVSLFLFPIHSFLFHKNKFMCIFLFTARRRAHVSSSLGGSSHLRFSSVAVGRSSWPHHFFLPVLLPLSAHPFAFWSAIFLLRFWFRCSFNTWEILFDSFVCVKRLLYKINSNANTSNRLIRLKINKINSILFWFLLFNCFSQKFLLTFNRTCACMYWFVSYLLPSLLLSFLLFFNRVFP